MSRYSHFRYVYELFSYLHSLHRTVTEILDDLFLSDVKDVRLWIALNR